MVNVSSNTCSGVRGVAVSSAHYSLPQARLRSPRLSRPGGQGGSVLGLLALDRGVLFSLLTLTLHTMVHDGTGTGRSIS